jgi:hypothetical protein
MNIKKLEPQYYEAWNEFCFNHHWFWHSTHWIDYLSHSKLGVEFIDHSFFLEQNGQIVSIVPLIQEGDQLTSVGFEDRKEILREVKRIALENGIKRVQVNSDIKEYLNISGYTCILDLEDIRPSKGHKSAIKKSEKYLTYRETADIERFKADYFRIAGKVTRPDRTFELLGRWVNQGYGMLLEALFEDKTAGYAYVLYWKDYAYYFMSAVEPECKQYNVSHYLQSVAFDLLRQKGVQYYELGEQVYDSLICQPSDKERNISLFKRSFGGQIVQSPASEMFFDAEYMRQIYAERVNNYIGSSYRGNL